MDILNEKFEKAIFTSNKFSFINMIIITLVGMIIFGIHILIEGNILLSILLICYFFMYLFIIKTVWKITEKTTLSYYYYILLGLANLFFAPDIIMMYYYGEPIIKTQKWLGYAIGSISAVLNSRVFETKVLTYTCSFIYYTNIIFLTWLIYFLYGINDMMSYFNIIDFVYIAFIILMNFSNTYSKDINHQNYNKSMWENDFNSEKFKSMFKNLITPIIKINKEHYTIEINDIFKDFLRKIKDNTGDVDCFLDESNQATEYFRQVTKISEEYIIFYKHYMTGTTVTNNASRKNSLQIFEITELSIDNFYRKLYYLDKIFKTFKSYKTHEGTKKKLINKVINLFDLIFIDSKCFSEEEKSKIIGHYYIQNSELTTFDMSFRKSTICDVEMIDILFYDTSNITQIEKAKAETEVESRKHYLSLVSDKFMTPIQVLLVLINDITKHFIENNIEMPKKLNEIYNLGIYIQTLNQDITSCSRMEGGLEVNFATFEIKDLFHLCQEITNILIKNNSTKCYAIKTKLIIYPDVPTQINSDINRLRQVLINFLSNAYKFTLSGEIKILVKLVESKINYDEISVSIQDTGTGITVSNRESIFNGIKEIENLKHLTQIENGIGLLLCNIITCRLGTKFKYVPMINGSKFYFTFFNIKSNKIEISINKDKYSKMIDVVKEDNLPSTAKIRFNNIDSHIDFVKSISNSNSTLTNSIAFDRLYNNKKLNDKEHKVNDKEDKEEKEDKVNDKENYLYEINNNDNFRSTKIQGNRVNNLSVKKTKKYDLESLTIQENGTNDIDYNTDNQISISPFLINEQINKGGAKEDQEDYEDKEKLSSYIKENCSNNNIFLFDDNVFDFYKINKDDSIFTKSTNNLPSKRNELQNNKYSTLFYDICEICSKYHENTDFLKMYENFKPYIKFFYQNLLTLTNKPVSNIIKSNKLKRILLVDDNKIILKALKNITTSAIKDLNQTNNIQIIKAYDGVDALALFKIDHYISQSISYIISDQNMSMMDGCQFVKLVNSYKLGRDIKLYISSTDNEILKNTVIKNVEFINKPVRKTDLKLLLSSKQR